MKFYHWFSSHPNEIDLSGGVEKMQTIGKELRIVDAKQAARPKQTDFRWISSVPDIWSQHRLFEMLLLNKAVVLIDWIIQFSKCISIFISTNE